MMLSQNPTVIDNNVFFCFYNYSNVIKERVSSPTLKTDRTFLNRHNSGSPAKAYN